MIYEKIESPTECRGIIALVDIAGFARTAQTMSDSEVFDMLNEFYELVGDAVAGAGGRVVKFMGDAALVILPEDKPGQRVESLRSLKAKAEEWWSRRLPDAQITLKAHLGSVVCGLMGTVTEKRFDIIGAAVVELFLMQSGDFVLSPDLERALEGS